MLCPQLWETLHARLGRVVDATCVCLALLYNIIAHSVMVFSIVHFDLPPVSAVFLSIEQVHWTVDYQAHTMSLGSMNLHKRDLLSYSSDFL